MRCSSASTPSPTRSSSASAAASTSISAIRSWRSSARRSRTTTTRYARCAPRPRSIARCPRSASATAEPLAVHIGIASGEVVASGLGGARHRAYTVIGNSVNLAARLLKLAGAGETVLDEAVHAAAQRIARCAPIEDAKVKGIDAPLTAWRFVEFVDAGEPVRARIPSSAAPRSSRSSRRSLAQLRRRRHRRHGVRARRRRHRQVAARRRIARPRARRRASPAIPGSCSTSAWPRDARRSAKSSSAC